MPEASSAPARPPTTVAPTSEGLASWFAADEDSVMLFQWTVANLQLQGSLQIWRAPTRTDGKPTADNLTVTGSIDGDAISVTISGQLGSKSTWTGVVHDRELVLQVLQEDGRLAPMTLRPGTVEDYNAAVGRAEKALTDRQTQQLLDELDAQVLQQEAADSQARMKAVEAADAAVLSSRDQLKRSQALLAGYSFTDVLAEFERDWQELQALVAEIPGMSECGLRQSKAGQVESRAGQIESDNGALESQVGAAEAQIRWVTEDQAALTDAIDTMKRAHLAQGSNAPVPLSDADYLAVLAAADGEISRLRGKISSAQTSGTEYVRKANAAASQAVTTAGTC